jgi:glycosyl transferase family 87
VRLISPTWRICALGATLCVALTICAQSFGDRGGPRFMLSLTAAAVAYLLAIREFFAAPKFPRQVLVVGLVMSAVWHVQFLATPPGSDDDVHRYLWDGRLQRLGHNPYLVVPNDPAVAGLHTAETRTLNNPNLASPYPAGAELFFRLVTALHESVLALKLAFVVCDFAIAFLLLDLLRRNGQAEHWVLAYAWHPLLAIEVAGSGHVDIVGVLLLLVSVAALARRWRTLAAITFGLAVSVKLLPIILLPLYWKRVRIRDMVFAAIIAGLLYVPFLDHGRIPLGSLGTYVQSFRFNDPVFAMLERIVRPQVAAAVAVLAGFLTAMWMRSRSGEELSPAAFAWAMAASLLCAPVIYPWYLLWLLPFLRSASTLPLLVWSLSILPTYYVWHLRTVGRPWLVPWWVTLFEYGSLAIAAAICWYLSRKRAAAVECSTARV